MHICEFCSIQFQARPQVKNPRACKDCQGCRQSANERDWRERNNHLRCNTYHKAKREVRHAKIRKLILVLNECLRVGKDFLGLKFTSDFDSFFKETFLRLGVRQINKFCELEKINVFEGVPNLKSTS